MISEYDNNYDVPLTEELRNKYENLDFKQIIKNSYDSIFVTDKLGNILLINAATAKLFGLPPEEVEGKNVKELIKKGVYNHSTALEAAESRSVVTELVKVSNGINLMSTSTPVLDENGEVIMVVTNTRDNDLVNNYIAALEKEKEKANRYKSAIEYLHEKDLEQKAVVAESEKMRQIIQTAKTIAKTDSTVILFGESGTGKEVIAKYIHKHSLRAKEPFIPVNCAAIPSQLLESEFFGYVKGAFTDANSQGKPGLFEIADKGTMLLDELGELPLSMQAKLLRVLETGEVQRLGSTKSYKMNVRLIAATNRDLKAMINENRFRSDLYYRLNVIPLYLPPLRERPEDIIAMANKFLQEYNRKYGLNRRLSSKTIETLISYKWPGNIRELKNVIERLTITSSSDELNFEEDCFPKTTESLQSTDLNISEQKNYQGNLKSVLKTVEEQYIRQVLRECNGKIGQASQTLGIHRTMLYRKMKEFEDKNSVEL